MVGGVREELPQGLAEVQLLRLSEQAAEGRVHVDEAELPVEGDEALVDLIEQSPLALVLVGA